MATTTKSQTAFLGIALVLLSLPVMAAPSVDKAAEERGIKETTELIKKEPKNANAYVDLLLNRTRSVSSTIHPPVALTGQAIMKLKDAST